jgi:hypothetical protein
MSMNEKSGQMMVFELSSMNDCSSLPLQNTQPESASLFGERRKAKQIGKRSRPHTCFDASTRGAFLAKLSGNALVAIRALCSLTFDMRGGARLAGRRPLDGRVRFSARRHFERSPQAVRALPFQVRQLHQASPHGRSLVAWSGLARQAYRARQ